MRSILIFVLVFATILSCRKTPIKADPCADFGPVSLGIIVDEFGGDSIIVDTDSVIINRLVTLRAVLPKGRFAYVKWKVGSFESSERVVPLGFLRPGVSAGEEVQIQLTAEFPPNPCFPGERTRDTVYRTIRIIDQKDASIIGRYKGLFGNDLTRKDTQTVEIKFIPPDNVFTDGQTAVINVPKGCNSFATNPSNTYWYMIESNGALGNNFRLFSAPSVFMNGCLGPLAYLKLKPNDRDSLIVDYFYSESINRINPRIQDQFRGKRIR